VVHLKVEKIKKMANNKYKIVFENGNTITTYDEVLLKNNILFHKEIDGEMLNKIEQEEEYYTLYNTIVKYMKRCIRSKKEVIDYLERQEGSKQDKDKIIKTLEEKGFINDEVFCESFISDKFYLSHFGPLKIRKELENHLIDETIISKYLSKLSDTEIYDTLYKMVEKKICLDHKHARGVLKQKLISYFLEKGFEGEMIAQIFDELYKEDRSILYKEYESIKHKLERKYTGKDLEYHIIQKLYQKGFLKEQIDKIKEESD
jgi:regulatory protein